MKRIISILITALMLTSALLTIMPSAAAKVPTANDMGGYENVCLAYTFRYSSADKGRQTESDLMPYTAYLDKNGNIKDFFFDSYLFLPCVGNGPSGARMHLDEKNPTMAIDWIAYVDDTFSTGTNVDALEKAFGKTKSALGNTDRKAGVFFTLLYPNKNATNFGSLGGRSLDFSKLDDRKYALKWMIDEQIARYEARGYKHLDLVGFYWLEEFIAADDDIQMISYAADYLHSKGLKFIWIPWYKANGYEDWKSYGFDVACMQPNLMWSGYNDPKRVSTSVQLSEKYGLSMEMECDSRVRTDEYFSRYLSYLEGGLNSSMMNAVKMYYQDARAGVYYQACYSSDPQFRSVYDLTYKYATKTLTQADIDAVRPEKVENDFQMVDDVQRDSLKAPGVNWLSIGKSYVACKSFVDGNGADYQQVSGKELTDGIIASEALTTDWHAFHHSLLDSDGKMSVTIDLGEQRNDLTHFYVHFDNRMESGIGSPVSIVLSVSDNGQSFRELATPILYMDDTDSCVKYETTPVSARYVKLSFSPSEGNFVFCSEFLVGVKDPNYVEGPSDPDVSTPDNSTPDESENEASAPDDDSSTEESANVESTSPDSSESNASEQSSASSDDEKASDEGPVVPIVIASVCVLAAAAVVVVTVIKKKKK